MTLFIGETIERMGKREEWSVPHEILIARFLTVVRACDREFANGTRLSTAPSFPPLEERGGDRSRKVTPPQLVSLSLSLSLSYFSVCIACGKMTMHRWPRARYALRGYALAAPGNSPLHERV